MILCIFSGTISGFYGYVVFLELDQDTVLTSEETSKVSFTYQSFMRGSSGVGISVIHARIKRGRGPQVGLDSTPKKSQSYRVS